MNVRLAPTPFFRPGCGAFALIALLLLEWPALAADEDAFQKTVGPFLKQHCVACHGPAKQESRLRLDQVTGVEAGNRSLWTMVHERILAGEMPPAERPQPSDAEKKQVLSWIAERQRRLGASGSRRLNRRELSAALRDVTGMEVDFSAALPGDGTVAGFDTGAEGLQEAADAVATWVQLTSRAVDGIRFLESGKDKVFSVDLRQAKDVRKAFDAWRNDGITYRGPTLGRPGMGLLLEGRAVGERDELRFTIPPSRADHQSVFRVTLIVSAWKPVAGLPNPRLWVEVGGKSLDFAEITATTERPQKLTYVVHLGDVVVQKGVNLVLSSKVELPYAVSGFQNEEQKVRDPVPGGTGLFRPQFDRRQTPLDKQPTPFVVVQEIHIEPDVVQAWPPPSWQVKVAVKDDVASAQRLLALWTERAWRRPVSDKDVAPFLKLYEKLRGKGLTFDPALRAAFQAVLLSAPFRYQTSPGHTDPVLAQYATASRLSFMLLGAPPDAELLCLAREGKLREPAVLDGQVDRLLADPRSQAFVRPFVLQWLEMEQPITIAQDYINRQDFRWARYLKASMREETLQYITRLLAENRPARELIDSDWTMMNDALALHYGYPRITGGALRKVKLRPDDPRGGGILGHAGIQSMLCWMGDNWVIYRGAWALRHILDQPPPPPPLEVPELNPADAKNKGKSFRELLVQHQKDNRCAVCHKSIDPVGFAFQNFDLSGRWRDVEHESYARGDLDGRIMWRGTGRTRPVDAAGRLPRGEAFHTFPEFKQRLVQDYQADLVRGLLKSLMIYATGRVPGIDQLREIRTIMRESRAQGYPVRDLVKAVVRSRAFLEDYQIPAAPEPSLDRRPK